MSVSAEANGKKIWVKFDYDAELVRAVKTVPGARFVPVSKGGPAWTVPLDLTSARGLRQAFGTRLKLGDNLRSWGRQVVAKEKELRYLGEATDATLHRLPGQLPDLAATLKDYQRAGVRFGAESANPLIADQPGLGKTLETIGAIFEAATEDGAHLVIAPKTSLDTVWKHELERWQPFPVFVPEGGRKERLAVIEEFENALALGPAWLVINPQMARLTKLGDQEVPSFPSLQTIKWSNIIVDECHKNAVRNRNTVTARGIYGLQLRSGGKRFALSGTPVGGKPINLWGILHYLNPEVFTSKWNWAGTWIEIVDNGFGKTIGGIKPGLEEEFFNSLRPYMLRRTKEEVAKELPPKQFVDVWCDMSSKQAKQYTEFDENAEIKIDEQELSATSILAEYTRLKQFASAYHDLVFGADGELKIIPTVDSGKLDQLERLLDERGIFDPPEEQGKESAQMVIFSQFSQMVDMVYEWLKTKHVKAENITGATNKRGQRAEIQRSFQSGAIQVLVMTTTAGGVAITLDRADSVVFLDETWTPDDQEQASDRVHRVSRIHQVTVYTLRTKGTIEEQIMNLNLDKDDVNKAILDTRRSAYQARKG